MPIYDYYCPICGKVEEHFHGMNETPKYICEDCDKQLKRKMNTFEFTFGNGGTIRKTFRDRYGNPKHKDSTPTPSESAKARANKKKAEIGQKQYDPSNPYG